MLKKSRPNISIDFLRKPLEKIGTSVTYLICSISKETFKIQQLDCSKYFNTQFCNDKINPIASTDFM